jgi:aminopeptidase N
MTSRFLSVALLVGFASTAQARQYHDSYPRNPNVDMLSYVFTLTFSDESDELQGVATATARYLAAGQRELQLDLIRATDSLGGKGMTVTQVESDGHALSFRHEGDRLFVDLGHEMEHGERIAVTVHYHGIPAAGLKIGPNKYGDRTFFSDNWSSRVRNWLPVVDHPSDKATTEMIVIAPDKYQVASNGTIAETTDLGDGNRMTHYVNPVPTATWLYFVGVAQFAVQLVDTYDDVPIETWVYWQDRDKGFYDFAEPSKKVMAFFSDLVGPYVNHRLANIVSNATPGGGMEAASTPAYSDRSVTGERTRRWQLVIIHEIAHQWFGNAVTELYWNDVWLSEGFATYYTLLFRQHWFGQDDFIAGLQEARNTVIRYYSNDYDFQVVRDYIDDLNNVSGPMMYQKGAWFLHMLRETIGVDAFNAAIHSYYAEFINRNAQTADLRRHMEEASGRNLEQFFKQWLFQGGIPELRGSWSVEGRKLVIDLQQVQKTYAFDLNVDFCVELADGSSETMTVHLGPGEPVTATKTLAQQVMNVVIDPNTRILAKWTFGRQ